MLAVDENGWIEGPVAPLDASRAYSLLSPEAGARVDAARWTQQARTFFGAELEVVQSKRYPSGTVPLADALEVEVRSLKVQGSPTRVSVRALPLDRAPDALEAARAGERAIGGAGFDVLVTRGKQLWQVASEVPEGGDARAALAVAAVIASVLLAPIVPPEGNTIFGVKGARERLEARGWRT